MQIFIEHIHSSVNPTFFYSLLEEYGKVKEMRLVYKVKREKRKQKDEEGEEKILSSLRVEGHAYILMPNDEEAQKAIVGMHKRELKGMVLSAAGHTLPNPYFILRLPKKVIPTLEAMCAARKLEPFHLVRSIVLQAVANFLNKRED